MIDENKILEAVELARTTGKIRKGVNEVTKALEKGEAKLVIVAKDVNPKEIVMHLPLLAKEKNIPFVEVSKKDDLGAAAGIDIAASSVAVVNEGEAGKIIKEIREQVMKMKSE